MRYVSLREFRTRGAKALGEVPRGETVLLSGQGGPAYFLVPVVGDVAAEDRELRRALARASLRASWAHAEARGLDMTPPEAIDEAVTAVRRRRKKRP
ncbi:MAG: prevent-host-death protein [Deltaproteobacteria bacterium]|nr:prevent-host-death protein [Deltaproteobacteria bacterium]